MKFSERMQGLSLNFSSEYRVRITNHDRCQYLTEMVWIDSPVDPSDTMLPHYLIATWAKVCQAMGPEFEPYLPVVMPPLFRAANAKADVSVYGWFGSIFGRLSGSLIESRGRGRSRVQRRLGHHRNGRAAGRDQDISNRREVPGV